MISCDRVRQLLRYDMQTGVFTWRVKTGTKAAGSIAGSVHESYPGKAYVRIQVDGRIYRAARLAWIYMRRVWPAGEVDHINGDGTDDRWANLLDVSHNANMQNQVRPHKNNKTRFLGVHPQGDKFRARIWVNGRNLSLGLHPTPESAHAAYITAKRQLHEGNTL